MKRQTLFTIGYQGMTQESFFNKILSNGVKIVIDVRAIPHSRKKGFSKKGLESRANELGLKYEHIGSLGTPDDIRKAFKLSGNFEEFAGRYLDTIAHEDDLLNDLSQEILKSVCCLLCYEQMPSECHRSLVAGEIAKRIPAPLQVLHI